MRGIGTEYNPWRVRGVGLAERQKREGKRQKRERGQNKEGSLVEPDEAKENKASLNRLRPGGDLGKLWDGGRYLFEIKKCLGAVRSSFHSLKAIVEQALNPAINDIERKHLQRKYNVKKSEYNRYVASLTVDGEILFLGDFSHAPKVLPLPKNKKLEMILSNLDANGLEIAHLRVDALVSARRAEKRMQEAERSLQSVEDYLRSRKNFLNFLATELHFEMPDFEKLEKELEHSHEMAVNPVYSRAAVDEEDESREFLNTLLLPLKQQQERAAKAKGRKKALLISTRG